jgi:tRNA-Thr(GGU) m(6)t(6)A37 methyltransferase TsaA
MAEASEAKEQGTETVFQLRPVGRVEKKGDATRLRIDEGCAEALKGLEDWSHVWVFYWFDKNDTPEKRGIRQVRPRGNSKNPLTGVFACRAPVRPNLIAMSLCKVLSVEGGVVRIDRIDAFDNTPVLDLKPYIPSIDRPRQGDIRQPKWMGRR